MQTRQYIIWIDCCRVLKYFCLIIIKWLIFSNSCIFKKHLEYVCFPMGVSFLWSFLSYSIYSNVRINGKKMAISPCLWWMGFLSHPFNNRFIHNLLMEDSWNCFVTIIAVRVVCVIGCFEKTVFLPCANLSKTNLPLTISSGLFTMPFPFSFLTS